MNKPIDKTQKSAKKTYEQRHKYINTNEEQIASPSPRDKYKIHLKNAEDVRRLLSSTINELRQNKIDGSRAGKIIYAASVLLNVFDQYHLEERLRRIEEAVKKR